MSNITKNLLLGISLVCVIVLIVFCIQIIVLNRGADPEESEPVMAGDEQDENGDLDGESPDDENLNVSVTPRPPPQGTRRVLTVTENSRLIIYSRDELFDFEERDLDWWFLYTGGGVATLEISFTMVSPQGIEAHATTFLNRYSGGTEAEFTGEESIMGSSIRGYHVSARHGNEMYEAWIHTLEGSDLALVFVINYENDQQRDALYEVLSTLDIDRTGTAEPDVGGTAPDVDEPDGDEPDDAEPDGAVPDEPEPDDDDDADDPRSVIT